MLSNLTQEILEYNNRNINNRNINNRNINNRNINISIKNKENTIKTIDNIICTNIGITKSESSNPIECKLDVQFFNPEKNSPPNEWQYRLMKRINSFTIEN